MLGASVQGRDIMAATRDYLKYNAQFGKSYASLAEFSERQARWMSVDDHIAEFNAEDHTWKLGHNHMSDWTDAEKAGMMNNRGGDATVGRGASFKTNPLLATYSSATLDTVTYAAAVDWRTDFPNFPVRFQDQCGSCYAHTSTYSVEYAWAIEDAVVDSGATDGSDY